MAGKLDKIGCPISRASFAREVGGTMTSSYSFTPVLSRILSSQQVPHRRPSPVRNDIPYLWGFRILLFHSSYLAHCDEQPLLAISASGKLEPCAQTLSQWSRLSL